MYEIFYLPAVFHTIRPNDNPFPDQDQAQSDSIVAAEENRTADDMPVGWRQARADHPFE